MVEAERQRPLHATQGTDFEPLTGTHDRTVDDKGRIVLPAGDWRDAFGAKAYVGPWRRNGLALWPVAQFVALLDKVAEQEAARVIADGSIELFREHNPSVAVDGHGRLTLPPGLRDLTGIVAGAPIFIRGAGDRLEIERLDHVRRTTDDYLASVEMLDHR